MRLLRAVLTPVQAGKCSFLNLLATDVAHPEQVGHTTNYSSSQLAGSGASVQRHEAR